MIKREKLEKLGRELKGELYTDDTMRTLYATDASAYREMPLAVAIPEDRIRYQDPYPVRPGT